VVVPRFDGPWESREMIYGSKLRAIQSHAGQSQFVIVGLVSLLPPQD
jgi:hypothetical protein